MTDEYKIPSRDGFEPDQRDEYENPSRDGFGTGQEEDSISEPIPIYAVG